MYIVFSKDTLLLINMYSKPAPGRSITMLSLILAELPLWLDSVAKDLGSLWPIILFIGAVVGLIRWITSKFKEEVRELIVIEIEPLKAEFKNNGGSSFKDAIDRLENNYSGLKKDIDCIGTKFDKEHKNLRQSLDALEDKQNAICEEMQEGRKNFESYVQRSTPKKRGTDF